MSRFLATSLVAAIAIGAGVYYYVRSSKATKPSVSKQEKETTTTESAATEASAPVSEAVETSVATETPVATPVPVNVSFSPSTELTQLISLST